MAIIIDLFVYVVYLEEKRKTMRRVKMHLQRLMKLTFSSSPEVFVGFNCLLVSI